jgi:hypothetical protein
VSAQRSVRAWWDPGWHNLDQLLKVGRHDTFAFYRSHFPATPGYDLVFANTVGSDWDHRSATVESIEHARFGYLDEVACDPAWAGNSGWALVVLLSER